MDESQPSSEAHFRGSMPSARGKVARCGRLARISTTITKSSVSNAMRNCGLNCSGAGGGLSSHSGFRCALNGVRGDAGDLRWQVGLACRTSENSLRFTLRYLRRSPGETSVAAANWADSMKNGLQPQEVAVDCKDMFPLLDLLHDGLRDEAGDVDSAMIEDFPMSG